MRIREHGFSNRRLSRRRRPAVSKMPCFDTPSVEGERDVQLVLGDHLIKVLFASSYYLEGRARGPRRRHHNAAQRGGVHCHHAFGGAFGAGGPFLSHGYEHMPSSRATACTVAAGGPKRGRRTPQDAGHGCTGS